MNCKSISLLLGSLILITATSMTSNRASAAPLQCGIITCHDECTGSYLNLTGDTCTNQWDPMRQCWMAMATCNSQPPGPNCGSIICYDACTGRSEVFTGNTCVNVWDDLRGCYTARAECR